jgi:hypothetical protein
MMGREKKKVLESLPQYFNKFLPPQTVDIVTKMWKVMCMPTFSLNYYFTLPNTTLFYFAREVSCGK